MDENGWKRIFMGDPAGIEMLGAVKKRENERTSEQKDIAELHKILKAGEQIPDHLKKYMKGDDQKEKADQ
jgi:hypothetical protein